MTEKSAENNNDPPETVVPIGLEFQIKDTKLYVPVVTLLKENDNKRLEQLKSEFKRTVKRKKNRSQMTIQNNNNNLNYLIDSTFINSNRLFVFSFERIVRENNTTNNHRNYFSNYYVPNVEIKDFNVLIDGKSFFDLLVQTEEEAYEKLRKNY